MWSMHYSLAAFYFLLSLSAIPVDMLFWRGKLVSKLLWEAQKFPPFSVLCYLGPLTSCCVFEVIRPSRYLFASSWVPHGDPLCPSSSVHPHHMTTPFPFFIHCCGDYVSYPHSFTYVFVSCPLSQQCVCSIFLSILH